MPDRRSEDRQPSPIPLVDERSEESERSRATIEGQASTAVRERMLLPRILEGRDPHESIKELATAPSPKRRLAVTSDAGTSLGAKVQD